MSNKPIIKPKARPRMCILHIGEVLTGKSTLCRIFVNNYPGDVLIYDTEGDGTFDYLLVYRTLKGHFKSWKEYEKGKRFLKSFSDLKPGMHISIYQDGAILYTGIFKLLTNKSLFLVYRLLEEPLVDIVKEVEIEEGISIKVWNKVRVLDTYIDFPKEICPYLNSTLKDHLFIVSDGSRHIHRDRIFKQDLLDVASKRRHKGIDLYFICHRLIDVNREYIKKSNILIKHKEFAQSPPKDLKSVLVPSYYNAILKGYGRIEGHQNRYYKEMFPLMPIGPDKEQ